MLPAESAAPKPGWRRMQWIVVVVWVVVMAFLMTQHLRQSRTGGRTPFSMAAGFLTMLAHGAWITLDCKILNRRVGAWRFAAFFLGPLAIWPYLLQAYRLRALMLIPLSALVYMAPIGIIVITAALGAIPSSLIET
jgi:hypothetical protein